MKAKAKPAKKLVKPTLKKSATPSATKKPPKKSVITSALEKQCGIIAHALDDNKAEDVSMIDLAAKCSFADRMFVASGRSQRHVSALADHVADALKKAGTPVLSIEGKDSCDWVLIDAGDIIVHIFRPEVRQFYNIEKMWALPVPV